uniref:Transcription termination factor rho n=1 Tax=Rhipicephalus zambeziensis TaxID=60191 RepID=A0A224Z1R0_9ACAR
MRQARQDPRIRSREAERKRLARQDPALRAHEAERKRQARQDPTVRALEAELKRQARQDPALRAQEAERKRQARQNPAIRALEAELKRRSRQDPTFRALEAARKRQRRQDAAVREGESAYKRRKRCEQKLAKEQNDPYDSTDDEFDEQFPNEKHGFTCDACDRWVEEDLTVAANVKSEPMEDNVTIPQCAFPHTGVQNFRVCDSCKSSLDSTVRSILKSSV